jgi:ABC-type multidrug transport system fused ATPase/permease subunit
MADTQQQPEVKPARRRIRKEELQRARKLLRYVRPYRTRFAAALTALALGGFLSLCLPILIQMLIDVAHGDLTGNVGYLPAPLRNLNGVAGLIVGLLTTTAVIAYFRVVWWAEVGERAIGAWRREVYAHVVRLPMAFYNQRRVGDLTSRLAADITQIQETFIREVPGMLRQAVVAIGGLIIVLVMYTKLAAAMLAIFPFTVALAMFLGRGVRKLSRRAQDRLAESNVVADETLGGIQVVKAFANEAQESRRYSTAIQEYVEVAVHGAKVRAGLVSFIILGMFGSIVLVVWFGAQLVQTGKMSVGDLTAFVAFTVFIGSGLRTLGEFYANFQKTLGATENVESLLEEAAEEAPPEAGMPRLSGQVEFRGVHFTYPSRPENPVLRGINLLARPGQRVALVGPSGGGKSTIANLIFRFYEPDAGSLWIDGRPAAEYPLEGLRGQMALVPQDITLFGGSIRENIAYGKLDATDAEIEKAARQANAHEFITSFPEGYHTVVGERGIKLSGGQRQRIAIARAILRDPAILVLDEATSALDSESERLVQSALETLLEGRTSFIIAHRLSTIRNADKIVVIKEGFAVEEGRHEELMRREDGVYRSLSELQLELVG